MKAARYWALAGSVGLAVSFTAGMAGQAVAKPVPSRVMLHGSLTPASERAHPTGAAVKGKITFELLLKLRNVKGAKAFVRAVSSPGSKSFHKFLTDKQWMTRFGPSAASVSKAESWLRSQGFTGISVPKTHLFVTATGSVAKVEKTFGAQLAIFNVAGHKVHLSKDTLSIPSSMSGVALGVAGINQSIATNDLAIQPKSSPAAAPPSSEPAPPAGFVNPQPCSQAFNTMVDKTDPKKLYNPPFKGNLDYDICGYVPSQLRSAYQIQGAINKGDNGSNVTVAIVDAYDSPTLLADSQQYFSQNDAANALSTAQFSDFPPATVDEAAACGGSGWRAEQSLDVQSVHAMAPSAHINYFGAQDCENTSLLAALQSAVTSGASVVSDSWGSLDGDLFEDNASKAAFDDTFILADSTGVSVLFSSGDSGDNFAAAGIVGPDYPPASPFVTAVGGTTLEVNARGDRAGEFGWSVAKETLCSGRAITPPNFCAKTKTPLTPFIFNAGGGGGSSYNYAQPSYQAGVVPDALALRNEALFGDVPVRVEPDMSMDADAQSGMLIGLTQTFPDGVRYGQFKEGGTSLATPLLAGVLADADTAAGGSIGFANPVLYNVFQTTPTAFDDIQPSTQPDTNAVVRVDFANTVDASQGYTVSVRAIDYQGIETFTDGTGNTESRNVTLTTAPGFDSMTGLGTVGPDFIAALSKF